MTCGEARELFSALVDEALGPDERAVFDRHLAGCTECREELQRFTRLVSLVRAVEPERAPVGFVDRVLDQTGRAPWYRRLARWLVFPLPVKLPLGAAAAVLVGVLVSLLYRQSPELEQAARRDPVPSPPAVEAPAVSPAPAPPASEAPAASKPTAPPAKGQAPATPPPQKDAAPAQDALLSKQGVPESGEPGRAGELSAPAPRSKADAQRQAPEPAAPAQDKHREATPPEREARANIAAGKKDAAPDLAGRLTVAELAAGDSALGLLLARSGGRETGRRQIPDGLEVEVSVPRGRADEFARELSRIGHWQAVQRLESPGDPVRVLIQLVR